MLFRKTDLGLSSKTDDVTSATVTSIRAALNRGTIITKGEENNS